jgi:hypothetical protein
MMTKKPVLLDEGMAQKYIQGAPYETKKIQIREKSQKENQAFLNIPISPSLRKKLKVKAVLEGRTLYELCTEALEKIV